MKFVLRVLEDFGRKKVTHRAWRSFEDSFSFIPFASSDLIAVASEVSKVEANLRTAQRIVYLAVPPPAFVPTIEALGGSSVVTKDTKLMIEKPFGFALDSARGLHVALHEVFEESRIFRIDRFLGQEGVQNLLALRFANGLFEPAWNGELLDYVQIDVPEQLTIEDRGAFYERTGAFRDMVVTHLFQLLAFLAVEEPAAFDAMALHDKELDDPFLSLSKPRVGHAKKRM